MIHIAVIMLSTRARKERFC